MDTSHYYPWEHWLRCRLFRNVMITCSILHSPLWEADSHSASQGILAFYGTRRFITVFTTVHYFSRSWTGSVRSMPSRPTSLRSNLILSPHLRLDLVSGLFPLRFPHQNPVRISPLHHTCYMPRPSHFSYYPTHTVKSTNHEAPQYVVFSSPVTSSFFGPNIFLSATILTILSPRNSLNARPNFPPT